MAHSIETEILFISNLKVPDWKAARKKLKSLTAEEIKKAFIRTMRTRNMSKKKRQELEEEAGNTEEIREFMAKDLDILEDGWKGINPRFGKNHAEGITFFVHNSCWEDKEDNDNLIIALLVYTKVCAAANFFSYCPVSTG